MLLSRSNSRPACSVATGCAPVAASGAEIDGAGCCRAFRARSRSSSTAATCDITSSRRLSSRASSAFSRGGNVWPSQPRSCSNCFRWLLRIGSKPNTPCVANNPLIRFTCRVRSITSASRSRVNRRSSSSVGLGGRTIEQARRPPRAHSISVSSSFSTSIRSVFARRLRRFTAIEAASTTWLSTPFASRKRCTQKPSRPASWIEITLTVVPQDRSARAFSRFSRVRRAVVSAART